MWCPNGEGKTNWEERRALQYWGPWISKDKWNLVYKWKNWPCIKADHSSMATQGKAEHTCTHVGRWTDAARWWEFIKVLFWLHLFSQVRIHSTQMLKWEHGLSYGTLPTPNGIELQFKIQELHRDNTRCSRKVISQIDQRCLHNTIKNKQTKKKTPKDYR